MENIEQQRRICDSWYHQRWFRILLVIVGIDMILLGATFIMGTRLISLIGGINPIIRMIGGIGYVLISLYIIHHAMSYRSTKKETYLVCQHCAHIE